jgi:hypothetical protein
VRVEEEEEKQEEEEVLFSSYSLSRPPQTWKLVSSRTFHVKREGRP